MSLSPLNLPDEEAVSPLGLLPQREFIAESLRVLHDEGAVVELRAFRRGEVVSGYYDGHDRLARDAWNLEGRPRAPGARHQQQVRFSPREHHLGQRRGAPPVATRGRRPGQARGRLRDDRRENGSVP